MNVSTKQNPRDHRPGGQHNGGGTRVLAIVRPGTDIAEAQREEQRAQWRAELAARDAALGVIRQHLESQPTASLVRACGRRWAQEIRFTADAIAKAMNSTEADQ